MNRIHEMIKELCPDGVERVRLGDICTVLRGKRLTKSQLSDNQKYPVYHGGKDPIGYYSDSNRPADTVMIINVGASAGTVGYSSSDFWSSDGCFCISQSDNVVAKYLYQYLFEHETIIKSQVRNAGIPTLNSSAVENIEIPLPPLAIQQEIVSVLDSFTTLIDKMKQEVEKRKKQMEYYREKLLTFDDGECEWKTLAEVCKIKNGYTPSKSNSNYWEDGTIPWFRLDDIRQNGRVLKDATQHITQEAVKRGIPFKANSVIVSTTATIGEHALIEVPFVCNQQITVLTPNNSLLSKYLYFLGYGIGQWCKANVNGAGLAIIPTSRVGDCEIPIPSIERQSSIVSTLDKFESYISKLEKMIALRQKQYEYYREQLLTFE